tara:strand:+ start:157 stop:1161 length:1005 start_codon:yes stop_codon:yes gene_type:complete
MTAIPKWVKDRIWALRQADVPRDEVVKILSGEGAKVSTRTVSKYGGIESTALNPEKYADLYPDLSSKLLSKDKSVVANAMNTAKQRRYRVERPDVIKEVSARYRAGEAGQVYQKSYKSPKESVAAKNARRRALKKFGITGENFIPAFRVEVDEIYRLASLFPGEFDVDHILRLAGGIDQPRGKHEASNLQLLRKEVHKLKTALENSGRFEDAARVGAFNEYNLAPNVRGLLAENVKPSLMNLVGRAKPALKFAARAVPFLGASMGVKAADDYRRAGQNRLAAAAGMSALPGPLGWLGLAGEMGGLLWNKATEDPNFLRGPLDATPHIPRHRGRL